MAKLTAEGDSLDFGNTYDCYADGLEEVDQFGPNSTLRFYIVRRLDRREGGKRVAVLRLTIPTAAIPSIVGLLMKPQVDVGDDDCHEQSVH